MSISSDDDGNLLTKTDLATSVVTEFKWSDFNRLASIETKLSGTPTGDIKQTNTFGVNGFRRKKRDKNDVETTAYAAGLATAVSKATGGDTITYLIGHRLMGFERSSDGAMFWILTDALSSVRDVVRGTEWGRRSVRHPVSGREGEAPGPKDRTGLALACTRVPTRAPGLL